MYPIAGGASDDDDDSDDDEGGGDDGGNGDEDDVARIRRQARHHESENTRLKRELEEAKKAEARLKELEDAEKTELQREKEQREAAERAAAESKLELARTRVAMRKGLTESQARRLQGTTEEEIEADAEDLIKSFGISHNEGDDEEEDLPRRPREALRSGNRPQSEPEETDPRKLAASLPRY
jgi:flagellar biosynthesis GTPase FlhF